MGEVPDEGEDKSMYGGNGHQSSLGRKTQKHTRSQDKKQESNVDGDNPIHCIYSIRYNISKRGILRNAVNYAIFRKHSCILPKEGNFSDNKHTVILSRVK